MTNPSNRRASIGHTVDGDDDNFQGRPITLEAWARVNSYDPETRTYLPSSPCSVEITNEGPLARA